MADSLYALPSPYTTLSGSRGTLRPTIPDGPTPLPAYAACPDRTAPRDVVLWAAGGAPAGAVPKGRCRVGREVSHPGPSPDPDKEISTIRLFR